MSVVSSSTLLGEMAQARRQAEGLAQRESVPDQGFWKGVFDQAAMDHGDVDAKSPGLQQDGAQGGPAGSKGLAHVPDPSVGRAAQRARQRHGDKVVPPPGQPAPAAPREERAHGSMQTVKVELRVSRPADAAQGAAADLRAFAEAPTSRTRPAMTPASAVPLSHQPLPPLNVHIDADKRGDWTVYLRSPRLGPAQALAAAALAAQAGGGRVQSVVLNGKAVYQSGAVATARSVDGPTDTSRPLDPIPGGPFTA